MNTIYRLIIGLNIIFQVFSPAYAIIIPTQVQQPVKQKSASEDKPSKKQLFIKKLLKKENLVLLGSSIILLGYILIRRPFTKYGTFTPDNLYLHEKHISNQMLEIIYEQPQNSITAATK